MSTDGTTHDEGLVIELLAACDEALAAGQALSSHGDAEPAVTERVQRDLACIKLLREVLADRSGETAIASPDLGVRERICALPFKQLGRYEIRRELGQGSYGVVLLAHDPRLCREVALKVPRGEAIVTPTLRQRFLIEARAAAALNHPNIIAVHEAGEVGPVCYIAAEYCPGLSLSAWFQSWLRPVAARDAAGLLVTLAQAVHHAHERGVLHRDLKPSNIMLEGANHRPNESGKDPRLQTFCPKITDFGLAKFFRDQDAGQTDSGALVGTPQYMAPEQARGKGKAAGPAADVYALGAILYELLTGRPPFKGETSLDTLQQVMHDEPVPPRRLNSRVPRDLEVICLKCLEKEPHRRYHSALALAEDLSRFLAGCPILARPSSRLELTGRWCRRNPGLAALTASILVLLVGITVASSVATLRLRDSQRHLRRALQAEQQVGKARLEADDALLRASLEQANAERQGRQPGSRAAGLEALARVATTRPSRELRNQAITWMSQVDLEMGRRWPGHPPETTLVEFDPSLEHYARADDRGRIRIARISDDHETQQMADFREPPLHMLFGPDGQSFAAIGTPKREVKSHLRVWDLNHGGLRVDIPGIDSQALDFSPDGGVVAAGRSDGLIVLHDMVSGREVKRIQGARSPFSLAIDAHGRRIAVGYSGTPGLEVFALDDGKLVRSCPALGGPRCHLVWHPSGRFLVAAPVDWTHDWDIHVVTIDPPDWPDLILKGPGAPVHRIAFNHVGDLLAAVANDGILRLYSFPSAEPLTVTSTDFFRRALGIRFSRDDRHLAAVIDGQDLTILNVLPNQACQEVPYGHATHLSLSPDGKLLACADVPGVRIWDIETRRLVESMSLANAVRVAFTPDGESLITLNEGDIRQWRLERPPGATSPMRATPVRMLDIKGGNFSLIEAGPTLAIITRDGRVLISPLNSPAKILELQDPGASNVALSKDGRWAATAKEGLPRAIVKLWDVRRGNLLKELPVASSMVTLAFSPDSRWLVLGNGREYRFLKTGSWESGLVIPMEHRSSLFGPIAFAPDGKSFAIAMNNRTIRLLDTRAGAELATLDNGNPAIVLTIEFSRDGQRLAVARWGHSVQVWDLPEVRRRLAEMGLDWQL